MRYIFEHGALLKMHAADKHLGYSYTLGVWPAVRIAKTWTLDGRPVWRHLEQSSYAAW